MSKEEAIEFAVFASKWCLNNTSFEFHELDKESQNELYQEFIKINKEMSGFIDAIGKFLESMEPFPNCPKCGHEDVAIDDNGDYEFFFCTNMDPECGWESERGEYGLKVYDDEEED